MDPLDTGADGGTWTSDLLSTKRGPVKSRPPIFRVLARNRSNPRTFTGESLATEKYFRARRARENTPLHEALSANQRKPGPRCVGDRTKNRSRLNCEAD